MAKINNPRKGFQFQVYIPGINPFLCQDVKTPEREFAVDEHGDTNYDIKTAGKIKTGMIGIKKICDATSVGSSIVDWMARIQNEFIGGGELPSQYKEVIMIEQLAPNGVSVLQRWIYEGCWPQKINGVEFSRVKSENTTEDIDFCADRKLP